VVDLNHPAAKDAVEKERILRSEATEVQLPELDARLLHHVADDGWEVGGDAFGGKLEIRLGFSYYALEDSWRAAILDGEAR
jgi:hypothetical protein